MEEAVSNEASIYLTNAAVFARELTAWGSSSCCCSAPKEGHGSSHAPARATTALPVLALLASIAARYTTRLPITCATLSPRPTLLLLVPTPDLPIDPTPTATSFLNSHLCPTI